MEMFNKTWFKGLLIITFICCAVLAISSRTFAWEWDDPNGMVTFYSQELDNSDGVCYEDDIYCTNNTDSQIFAQCSINGYNVDYAVGGNVDPGETTKIGWASQHDSSQPWDYGKPPYCSWSTNARAF